MAGINAVRVKGKRSRNRESGWPDYNPQEIEARWQRWWEDNGIYRTHETSDQAKYYCLDFFPYPSGDGLHVGHCRNYVPTDVISRYKRMRGYNVLHPMGWDAFGEPAEQYAVAHGVHPRVTTDQNTANFRRQMTLIGSSYDWSREIDSSQPEFFRWTQWFFLLLYRRGLAYRDTNWQWWCPVCQTTLSSHEAVGGVCWRGHTGVTKREIPAWYFKITAYADELLSGLDEIDWPEKIKTMQRNWIGRSEGSEILFKTEAGDLVPVFTTRPDTLFGVTFFVLAPEHELVLKLTGPDRLSVVEEYIERASQQSEIERTAETGEKTGVFTGGFVINPANGEHVPVWIADYVLPGYGTGAVMGVPAHDQRDFEFAHKYRLPVRVVVAPEGYNDTPLEIALTQPGRLINSGKFDGLSSPEAIDQINAWLEEAGLGRQAVQYRMRDWLISRQRYWGTPIPIVYCQACGTVPVPEADLPVLLPPMENFQPDGSGRSPLARLPEFLNTTCPRCGGPAQRETDTMGGFACSSWYFLRFVSPHEQQRAFDPQSVRYWLPVDLYVGGAEHAVLHLLYARFWTRVMADAGLVDFREPFTKLMNQGQLMGPDGKRMSKSRGNVITPDSVVAEQGADTLRVYELFMAPFDQDISWSMDGLVGARRFLNRVWGLFQDTYLESRNASGKDPELERKMHQTIRRASERIDTFRFNTVISELMEFTNVLLEREQSGTWRSETYAQALDTLLRLLAPVAPHLAEEIWHLAGKAGSIHRQSWPSWDEELAGEEIQEIPVQVDGKVRDVIDIDAAAGEDEARDLALAREKIRQHLAGREIVRVVYIPGKILSLITRK